MRILELFSGTGSVGKVFKQYGWDVLSLDIDTRSGADIVTDILDWDYKKYEPGHFDFVWASPPCTEFSSIKAFAGHKRDIAGAVAIVQKTLDIIDYFDPDIWFLENPQSGSLKKQSLMADIPFCDVDYCQYGRYFRKRTRLWNNIGFTGKLCKYNCKYSKGTRHIYTIGMTRGKNSADPNGYRNPIWDGLPRATTEYCHQVPEDLVKDILCYSMAYLV